MARPPIHESGREATIEILKGHRCLTDLLSRHEIYEEVFKRISSRSS